MIGAKFAHYEITSHLGTGGMGEVYQAIDSKLGRNVAIKCLPEGFTHDIERVARFQREARVLASLNHPNIAAIYGLEETGGRHFLVMELVPGETLEERIRRGPIPMEETLGIARQIAEGLEAAHEKGIVHRDLKPANVRLTPDGEAKVLDFGLAKAMESSPASGNLSQSPTLSLGMTNAGVILGTAAYMSPEQARGAEADRRADVWAFGVVLYELLTGRRLFDEPTTSDTLAAVLKTKLTFDALPASTPFDVRVLLDRCLDRDRRRRLRDIGEARITLEKAIARPQGEAPDTVRQVLAVQPIWRRSLPWALAIGSLAVAAATAWVLWPGSIQRPSMMRLSVELGANAGISPDLGPAAVLSPDGKMLAFSATENSGDTPKIYVRKLDQLQAFPLAGTDGAQNAFFSPEGQWIAFFADGKLKKVPVAGGAVATLCNAPSARGGTWADDGFIIFTPDVISGLFRVSSAGGTPEPLTKLDPPAGELTHRWPQALPGGKAVLFTTSANVRNFEEGNIVVQSIPGGEKKVVQRGGSFGRYLPSGHLVYVHEAILFGAPFDLNRLEMTAPPVPVLEGVTSQPRSGGTQFAFSEAGSIVYLPGASLARGAVQLLQWMDRDGKTQPFWPSPARYSDLQFSPDGKRLAATITTASSSSDQGVDIWVYDWERDTPSRLTVDPAEDRHPVWTPDGRRIAFASRRADKTNYNIYWQQADGTGEPQRLTESKTDQFPASWHPTGKFFAFVENGDIMILPMEGDEVSGWRPGKRTAFLTSPFQERNAAFSPDGRWLAYESNESGIVETYVRPFPGPGGRSKISTAGGEYPEWSQTAKELFYRTPDQEFMLSTYTVVDGSFHADKPLPWSTGAVTSAPPNRTADLHPFDLHPDGKRFAVLSLPPSQDQQKLDKVVFIFNFFDELRRLAPPRRSLRD